MPLTLISVPIATVRAAQKAGTVDQTFHPLWDGIETCCFLCDSDVGPGRPFSLFMPDIKKPGHLVVLPLCPTCKGMPQLKRLHRAGKMLRQMWTRKGGPQVHFK